MKVGIIIIGSLLWESEESLSSANKKDFANLENWQLKLIDQGKTRRRWRDATFKKEGADYKKIKLNLPIRYARISSSRQETYTMVYSIQNENINGNAIVLDCLKEVNIIDDLIDLATKLSIAEGIANHDVEIKPLRKNWGSIILLPNLNKIKNTNSILLAWAEKFRNKNNINTFKILPSDKSSITEDGQLNIDWPSNIELSEFDFLLTTSVVPGISDYPTSKMIADKMINNQYFDYFINNYNSGIRTFQDEEIISFLPIVIQKKLTK